MPEKIPDPSTWTGNAILDALPEGPRMRIAEVSARRHLELGAVLYDVGDRLTHTFFPTRGVVSQLTPLADGSLAESSTIGRESCVGPTSILMDSLSRRRYEVRVAGEALAITIEDLHGVIGSDFSARNVFMREAQASLHTALQLAVCNRVHSTRQRLARWLLEAQDRTGSGPFLLKQATLADSLGVRRATVSEICSALAAEGAIAYSRGRMRIDGRDVLLAASCECYRAIATAAPATATCASESNDVDGETLRQQDHSSSNNALPSP